MIFEICKDDVSTQTGQNIAYLLNHYNIEDIESLLNSKKEISDTRVNALEDDECWKPPLIEELSLARLGFIELDLDKDYIDMLIEDISTT